jgi:uncharacterized protein (TIGR02246 family)
MLERREFFQAIGVAAALAGMPFGRILFAADRGENARANADLKAIRQLYEEDMEAHRVGDPDRAAAIYTEDVVWLPPSGPSIAGREAVRERYRQNFESQAVEFSIHSEETRIFGDWAFDRGTTVGTILPKSAESAPRPLHDKFIALFQKTPDAGWKIARLMWSPI